MKKIFALCMSAALLLQTCPVAFAASAKPPYYNASDCY